MVKITGIVMLFVTDPATATDYKYLLVSSQFDQLSSVGHHQDPRTAEDLHSTVESEEARVVQLEQTVGKLEV